MVLFVFQVATHVLLSSSPLQIQLNVRLGICSAALPPLWRLAGELSVHSERGRGGTGLWDHLGMCVCVLVGNGQLYPPTRMTTCLLLPHYLSAMWVTAVCVCASPQLPALIPKCSQALLSDLFKRGKAQMVSRSDTP